jgi:hypothetical protein
MPVLLAVQSPSASAQLQDLQAKEASLVKQLATAEAALKRYETESSAMSSSERQLNVGLRLNRESRVMGLRAELDQLRLKMADVRDGISSGREQDVVRVQDGPVIVTDVPATTSTEEAPRFFGLEPRQFREPALFILLFPLILAFSRWIWRRTPARFNRENELESKAQINRLEQAVESIAIEVERISEAQRFSAKLLAERPKEPVIERIRESARAERRAVTPLP